MRNKSESFENPVHSAVNRFSILKMAHNQRKVNVVAKTFTLLSRQSVVRCRSHAITGQFDHGFFALTKACWWHTEKLHLLPFWKCTASWARKGEFVFKTRWPFLPYISTGNLHISTKMPENLHLRPLFSSAFWSNNSLTM